MSTWAKGIEKCVKAYDSALRVQETRAGRFDVNRVSKYADTPPHYLFSLTDDWKPTGRPVEWGSLVVVQRLKAHDLWRNDKFVEEWIEYHEKEQADKERQLRNNIESFLWDFAPQFHKATSDINTSSLKKLYRKEDSHGYCEPRP